MPLNKLENFIKNTEGRILYVNPSDLDSTDAIENQGNSLTKPFKTIQRALLEAARFSWVKGSDNDIVEKTTILLYPGEHLIDNRPGYGILTEDNTAKAKSPSGVKTVASTELTLTPSSNFDLTQEDNILYKFNSIDGGVIVPRGTSLVGLDLRKTKVRPKYVPNPTDDNVKGSAIFRITGACYFWQFTTFDGDEDGLVYTDPADFSSTHVATPTFSHHKLTIFEYADGINVRDDKGFSLTDLAMYYSKLSNAFNPASGRDVTEKYPSASGGFSPQRPEYEIVGAFATDPISIAEIISGNGSTPGNVITVTTNTDHGLNRGTPIKIKGVAVANYNVSTVVTGVDPTDKKKFTYSLEFVPANLPPRPNVDAATVTIETDTVSGASPYIFNCSLRSVWGLNGMFADGAKATGFRSVVAAQFTGVSLQKDDRAFLKYDASGRGYEEISTTKVTGTDLSSGSSSLNEEKVYHLDSGAIYKSDWETTHIKATNDAVMQLVSIFAIGYTRHFDVRAGSDYSLTNSNSNFGQLSLVSTGFKKKAFTKDDKAIVTSVITPRAITAEEEQIDWQAIDVGKTTTANKGNQLYLYKWTDQNNKPPVLIQGYRVGAKSNDQLLIEVGGVEYSATINMVDSLTSSQSVGTISASKNYPVTNVSNSVLTIGSHGLQTGEKILLIADDGDLPENIEADKIYYAITGAPLAANQVKIASSLTNANNGTGITLYHSGSKLNVISRVSDKEAGDIGSPIQWDSTSYTWTNAAGTSVTEVGGWYVHTDLSTTGGGTNGTTSQSCSAIWAIIAASGVPSLGNRTDDTYLKRIPDSRSLDEKLYKLRVVIPKEFDNSKNPEEGFIIQSSSSTGFRTDADAGIKAITQNTPILSGEDYGYNRNLSFISTCTAASGTATLLSELPHGVNVGDSIIVKNISDTVNTTAESNKGFNGTFNVTSVDNSHQFKYSLTDTDGILHTTGLMNNDISSRTTNLPRFERNDCQNNYYIYRNDVISPYIEDIQDGVYHLYVINAGNNVGVAQFSDIGYSQNVTDLYPQLDRDNVDDNPQASASYARRSPLGDVITNDLKKSLTRESIDKFLTDFHIGVPISGVSTTYSNATDGTALITFSKEHGYNSIHSASVTTNISGGTPGIYYNVKLFDTGTVDWRGALATVTVNGSGNISAVEITSGGSGYSASGGVLDIDSTQHSGITAGGKVTFTGALVNNVIGNAVQITGVTTSTSGLYRISDVTAKNRITVAVNNNDPTIDVGQYALNVAPSLTVSGHLYDSVNKILTINTSTSHGLSLGNKIRILESTRNNLGDFIVNEIIDKDSFTVSSATDVSAITNSSSTILPHGLSANDKSSDKDAENLGARGLSFYDNQTITLASALAKADTTIELTTTTNAISRFELGSYVQVNDEIIRISNNQLFGSGTNELQVIRGSLGTSAVAHDNGTLVKKIKPLAIEFRRPSIIRASGHTFEYIGYGPGNYSTGLPQVQVKTLTEDEDYLAQAQERDCGTVVYTGMNSKGDFIIGNKKINSSTGKETTFDIPVPTVTGQDPSRLSVVFDEVIIKERLLVEGGKSNQLLTEFNGPVTFRNTVTFKSTEIHDGDQIYRGMLEVRDTTQSVNNNTGSITTKGGVGIAMNINVGGDADIDGGLSVHATTQSTSTTTGAAVIDGGAGIAKNLYVGGNLDVNGTGTFGGAVTAGGSITASGDSTVSGNITTDGGTFGNIQVGITNDNTVDTTTGSLHLRGHNTAGQGVYMQTGDGTTIAKFEKHSVSGNGHFELLGENASGSVVTKIINQTWGVEVKGGELRCNDDIVAFFTSDKNLKDNITPIEDPLAKVLSISGNTFNWNEKSTREGMLDTGVVAQEIEALGLPGVTTTRDNGTKAVMYEKLVPLLIEAIKELNAKVDALS